MFEISVGADRRPHMPEGNWRVLNAEHQPVRLMETSSTWSFDRIRLLSLKDFGWDESYESRMRPPVDPYHLVPVQVADYLYDNQQKIPAAWRGKDVLFWTVYEDGTSQEYHPLGLQFISALTWITNRWTRLYVPLLSPWTEQDMIAAYI